MVLPGIESGTSPSAHSAGCTLRLGHQGRQNTSQMQLAPMYHVAPTVNFLSFLPIHFFGFFSSLFYVLDNALRDPQTHLVIIARPVVAWRPTHYKPVYVSSCTHMGS